MRHIFKKANKRLYTLHVLKKSGLNIMQLVQVYCSIVRSVLEYACPVWAALPKYLDDAIESVQKRALRIILPNCHYDDALIQSGIITLSQRREEACTNVIKRDCLSSLVLNLKGKIGDNDIEVLAHLTLFLLFKLTFRILTLFPTIWRELEVPFQSLPHTALVVHQTMIFAQFCIDSWCPRFVQRPVLPSVHHLQRCALPKTG